jgi:exopolysaccharide production protein ExoY
LSSNSEVQRRNSNGKLANDHFTPGLEEHAVVSDFETLFVDSSVEDIDSSVEHIETTLCDLSQTEALDPATLSNSYRNIEGSASATSCANQSCSEASIVASYAYRPVGGAIKRVFDTVAALAAIAALLPLFALLCLAVRAELPGPVLFRQRRIGFKGEEFVCLKFRTMAIDAERALREYLANNEDARREWQTTHKLRNDPRITMFGRCLRRSSLDELPQLFNVLVGHMSIVGPRPIVAEEIPRYQEHFSLYASARPGLTGLWQISGRNTTSYPQRVAYDVDYVRNWSLIRDIRILLATANHVWEQNGAY